MEEQGLIMKKVGEERRKIEWKEIGEEVKRVSWLAGPMVTVMLCQFLIQVVTLMVVGHLGALYLASTALAISVAAVSGFSFLDRFQQDRSCYFNMHELWNYNFLGRIPYNEETVHLTISVGIFPTSYCQLLGMAGALETISGQSYGAQQYKKLGTQTYTAIFSLTLVSIPLCIIWINMGKILVFIGQDPSIAHEAGRFMTYLVPTLFAYAVVQPLVRYFQSQSLVMPMFFSSCVTLCLHIVLCWALVFKTRLRNVGGAVAMGISMWSNAIFLALYMMFSSSCAATRCPLSFEIFHGFRQFFYFALPSAAMVCFEWWSFELLILLSGLLPNPELETSVLSVCLTTLNTLFEMPYGLGAAARIANELGAGNPQGACIAAYTAVMMGVTNGVVVSSILFAIRNVFGYCFSSEKEVVDYVTEMAPLVCVNVILDSLQSVLSGIARGCGWQNIGSVVNLVAYYGVGIPVAAALGFGVQMRGRGLLLGILCGVLTQCILLSLVTSRTNWEEKARKASRNVAEKSSRNNNGVYADAQKPLLN